MRERADRWPWRAGCRSELRYPVAKGPKLGVFDLHDLEHLQGGAMLRSHFLSKFLRCVDRRHLRSVEPPKRSAFARRASYSWLPAEMALWWIRLERREEVAWETSPSRELAAAVLGCSTHRSKSIPKTSWAVLSVECWRPVAQALEKYIPAANPQCTALLGSDTSAAVAREGEPGGSRWRPGRSKRGFATMHGLRVGCDDAPVCIGLHWVYQTGRCDGSRKPQSSLWVGRHSSRLGSSQSVGFASIPRGRALGRRLRVAWMVPVRGRSIVQAGRFSIEWLASQTPLAFAPHAL